MSVWVTRLISKFLMIKFLNYQISDTEVSDSQKLLMFPKLLFLTDEPAGLTNSSARVYSNPNVKIYVSVYIMLVLFVLFLLVMSI